MKLFKTKVLILLFIGIGVISCQKEEGDIASPVASENEKGVINDKADDTKIKMRKLFWTPGHDGAVPDCTSKITGNCFPDVDVKPSMTAMVGGIFDVVGVGNQVDIQSAFQSNYSDLSTLMSTEIIDDVINGSLLVTETVNNQNNIRFLLFHSGGVINNDNPQAAIPFK